MRGAFTRNATVHDAEHMPANKRVATYLHSIYPEVLGVVRGSLRLQPVEGNGLVL